MAKRQLWHYYPAGCIEHGKRREWRQGYTRVVDTFGTIEYPWLTLRQAQSFAKQHGAKAVFHVDCDAAVAALTKEAKKLG